MQGSVVLDTFFRHVSNKVGAGKNFSSTHGGFLMTQKWTFFTIGIMAGMIALLSFSLLLQASQPTAYAAPTSGSADPSAGIVLATGGSQQNLNDICWVLYKRKNTGQANADSGGTQDDITNKESLISLGCYQVTKNGKMMKLVGLRNVTYDMDLLEYQNERPNVSDIVKSLRNQKKKK